VLCWGCRALARLISLILLAEAACCLSSPGSPNTHAGMPANHVTPAVTSNTEKEGPHPQRCAAATALPHTQTCTSHCPAVSCCHCSCTPPHITGTAMCTCTNQPCPALPCAAGACRSRLRSPARTRRRGGPPAVMRCAPCCHACGRTCCGLPALLLASASLWSRRAWERTGHVSARCLSTSVRL
jgi:hypothetical protein